MLFDFPNSYPSTS